MIETSDKYFEKKYLVPPNLINNLSCYLNQYFVPVSEFSEGYNNSIYFDDKNLNDYQDGINGMSYRKKIRIRYYGTKKENTNLYNFELKEKIGSTVQKKRIKFKSKSINTGKNLFSILNVNDLSLEAAKFDNYNMLFTHFPRVLISYKRKRYICPITGLRINLDQEIKCKKFWNNFNNEVHQNILCNSVLLEIKGKSNPMLPKTLKQFKLKNLALSKYCFFISKINMSHNYFKFLDSSSDEGRLSGWSF